MYDDSAPAAEHSITSLRLLATVTKFPKEIPETMTNAECVALRNEVRMHHDKVAIAKFQKREASEALTVRRATVKGERFFYVIRIAGNHFKTGIAYNVANRLSNYRSSNPSAVVVDTWPCPLDISKEKAAQHKMRSHPSCTWAGSETFTVHDEAAFIRELRGLFDEPVIEESETRIGRTVCKPQYDVAGYRSAGRKLGRRVAWVAGAAILYLMLNLMLFYISH